MGLRVVEAYVVDMTVKVARVLWPRLRTMVVMRICVTIKMHQRGVQWKQGVVVHIIVCVLLLHNATPIHCTPSAEYPNESTIRTEEFSARKVASQSPRGGREQEVLLYHIVVEHSMCCVCIFIYIYIYRERER